MSEHGVSGGSGRSSASPVRSGTRVVLLGSGTPIPEHHRSGPALAIIAGGSAYLVDAGAGVVRQARAAFDLGINELNPVLLSTVFFTHLHADHTLGFADLMLTPAIAGRWQPLEAYGPPGLSALSNHLLAAYAPDIALRTASKTDLRGWEVRIEEVEPGLVYTDGNVRVSAFQVEHGSVEHAYGYRFDTADRSIVISGDTTPCQAVVEACNGCDLLVHEVYGKAGFDLGHPSWQHYHATHHSSTHEVARIAEQAGPKLLVLTHVLDFGTTGEVILEELRSRYDGEMILGEDLVVY